MPNVYLNPGWSTPGDKSFKNTPSSISGSSSGSVAPISSTPVQSSNDVNKSNPSFDRYTPSSNTYNPFYRGGGIDTGGYPQATKDIRAEGLAKELANRNDPWSQYNKNTEKQDMIDNKDQGGDYTSLNSNWYKNLLNNPLKSIPSRGFKKEKKQNIKPSFKV